MKKTFVWITLLLSLCACNSPKKLLSCEAEFQNTYNENLNEALADSNKWELQGYVSAQAYAKAVANLHLSLLHKLHLCE
jgi:hypothetical protein